MKRHIKYIVLAVLVLAVLMMACSCTSNSSVTKPEPKEGATTYEITGDISVEKIDNNTLRVRCTTNIMEGTTIVFSIDSYEGENLARKVVTMPELKDGNCIYADFEIDSKWEGPITAALSVTPEEDGKQAKEVQETYGSKLENITGEDILFNSKGNMICFQTEQLTEY